MVFTDPRMTCANSKATKIYLSFLYNDQNGHQRNIARCKALQCALFSAFVHKQRKLISIKTLTEGSDGI